jgi:membrane-associated protein
VRRFLAVTGVAVAAFAAGITISSGLTSGGFGLLDEASDRSAYFLVFFFVAADAVIPIFPGETTLNAASVLASEDKLQLISVIVAGALGAIAGDSALYWIARSDVGKLSGRVEKLRADARIARALEILGERAPLLIVFGRYVPGVRFVVNFLMGLTRMPYLHFLGWSIIGGTTWAAYTCLLAYSVGAAIDDYPIASIVISGAITTALIGIIFWLDFRRRKASSARTEIVDG